MDAFIIYAAKASGILILFYLAYLILLRRETFFRLNRAFLLSGLILALLLPLIVIREYVVLEANQAALFPSATGDDSIGLVMSKSTLGPLDALYAVFLFGIGFMVLRFTLQLLSVIKILKNNRKIKLKSYTLVETTKDLAPFSFFRYIFYNPEHYHEEELKAVLEHEKVHCNQWHSMDILLGQLVLILLWVNPISWLYLNSVRQNLEFLADQSASKRVVSRKSYEYAMLKISGALQMIPVTNNFYSSLIKKRIVMLHQSKSRGRNGLKTLLILPVLALFLWSFNTEIVYLPPEYSKTDLFTLGFVGQSTEIHIDKDTSNEELEGLKKDLRKKGVDFSYTAVRNEQGEIIDLSVTLSSGKRSTNSFVGSSSFNNDGKPIDPLTIVFDGEKSVFYTGEDTTGHMVHMGNNYTSWIMSDEDANQTIEIYKDNGKEIIKVDGKEISKEEFERMQAGDKIHRKHVHMFKSDDEHQDIMIMGDHDVERDVHVMGKDGHSLFFLEQDLDDSWLIMLNGEEVDQDQVRDLKPEEIETVNVYKGEMAEKKYGKQGKRGVVEISTKD